MAGKKKLRLQARTEPTGTDPGVNWPPYGHMHAVLDRAALGGPLPQGFADEAAWQRFVDDTLRELIARLWPRHDAGQWVGASAAWTTPLTLADFALHDLSFAPSLDQPAPGTPPGQSHRMLFEAEDEMPPGREFETVRQYMSGQPANVVETVRSALLRGVGALGPRVLVFKRHLQRPRPYQAALLLGREWNYAFARSAVTPAMMSGHAIQGVFTSLAAWMEQRALLRTLAGAEVALQRFGAALGDRRVYAGVHYATDNVASWVIALRMAPVCFVAEKKEALRFLRATIRMSEVYVKLHEFVRAMPGSALAAPMAWLEEELGDR